MDTSRCKHIRFPGKSDLSVNVEKYIKKLEEEFEIDIKKISQWESLIEKLHQMKTRYKDKLKDMQHRKKQIIEKLYIENYRPSPFELTALLARTSDLWKEIEKNNKKKQKVDITNVLEKVITPSEDEVNEEIFGEMTAVDISTVHPNTEIVHSNNLSRSVVEPDDKSDAPTTMPLIICTNQHKVVSPLGSNYIPLSYHSIKLNSLDTNVNITEDERILTNNMRTINCDPKTIVIQNNTEVHNIKFSLRNDSNAYVYIRYIGLTDCTGFMKFKLRPILPIKLCAGLSQIYKLRLQLVPNFKYKTTIKFKISNSSINKHVEFLNIPINYDSEEDMINKQRSIDVSKTVNIRSVYQWEIKGERSYPFGELKVTNNGDRKYHVHIEKRSLDLSKCLITESPDSLSVEHLGTESYIIRNNTDLTSNLLSLVTEFQNNIAENVEVSEDITTPFINDVIDACFDTYLLEHTYLYIASRSEQKIKVYFTKPQHIGLHQCYYDLNFYDTDENIVLTRTVRVFSEVLPHPVQIYPPILDMTNTPVSFGLCVDFFTISNIHKSQGVSIKVQLTEKMIKLFRVSPMKTLIQPMSSVKFEVSCCPRSKDLEEKRNHQAYFTIKILLSGHKSIYQNVPHMYYELILPCVSEFCKVYNKSLTDYKYELSPEELSEVEETAD
ncbi:uncharacterized protein LOC126971932 [Leptidea sinapis]|uniref:uncharacterized protein LOC126971932 n=1 Tax=Leptidea sinapis TaxID=189913 RepID=UPI0021C2BB26|nr:uncharacterized protein LOC126971932 [Leptidea sinapis]